MRQTRRDTDRLTVDDAARATWESIKQRPQVAELIQSDPVFKRFVRQLVEQFGALEAIEINETVVPSIETEFVGRLR